LKATHKSKYCKNIDEYKWASSVCKGSKIIEKEKENLEEFYNAKFDMQGNIINQRAILPLNKYFDKAPSEDRNKTILKSHT